ncbi:MAG: Hsp20/alpha crystallin family protein [Desulfosarcinaceae bacterium]|jgi:HSP20 family protein
MFYRRLYNYPTRGFWNAFEQLDRMRRQLDQVFGSEVGTQRGLLGAGVFPQINLTEDADRFYIRAELPGVTSDALEIQATGKNLSLSGERQIEAENEGVRYHRREREAGKFSRIITLPTEIDPDRIEAKLEDGVLTIRVPKAEAVKPRQITIN